MFKSVSNLAIPKTAFNQTPAIHKIALNNPPDNNFNFFLKLLLNYTTKNL